MTDSRKLKTLLSATTALILLALVYSVMQDRVAPGLAGYLERKAYYERVILNKTPGLHEGLYWKEKP